jgi:hypothetical protein
MWIVFVVSTLVIMIIMLNLLIAIISDSYDKVIGAERLANNYERAELVREIEKMMTLREYKRLVD